jgi:hypothetical protein
MQTTKGVIGIVVGLLIGAGIAYLIQGELTYSTLIGAAIGIAVVFAVNRSRSRT